MKLIKTLYEINYDFGYNHPTTFKNTTIWVRGDFHTDESKWDNFRVVANPYSFFNKGSIPVNNKEEGIKFIDDLIKKWETGSNDLRIEDRDKKINDILNGNKK